MKKILTSLFLMIPSIAFGWTSGSFVGTIQNSNTLQSGATFYVSSGSVAGQLSADTARFGTSFGIYDPSAMQGYVFSSFDNYQFYNSYTGVAGLNFFDKRPAINKSMAILYAETANYFSILVSTNFTTSIPINRMVIYSGVGNNKISLNPINGGFDLIDSSITFSNGTSMDWKSTGLNFSSSVTATEFYGDGSNLTGIAGMTSGSTMYIQNSPIFRGDIFNVSSGTVRGPFYANAGIFTSVTASSANINAYYVGSLGFASTYLNDLTFRQTADSQLVDVFFKGKADSTVATGLDFTGTWITSTLGSQKARYVFNIWDTAAREAIRLESDGSTGRVGIGGAVNSSYLLAVNGSEIVSGTLDVSTGTFDTLSVDGNTLVANLLGYENTVGIGTTTPRDVMDVNGNILFGTHGAMTINGQGGGFGANLRYYSGGWKYINTGKGSLLWSGGLGEFSVYTAGTGTGGTSATLSEKLRISNNGGLSIGSAYVGTDPGAGNVIITGTITASAFSVSSGSVNGPLNVVSTGTPNAISIVENGIPSGGLQNENGGALNIKLNTVTDGLVIVSSIASAQAGSAMEHLWNYSASRNDPMLWIHDMSAASNPQIRIDGYAPNFEVVNKSTDNTLGYGKWEPFAMAYGGVDLQINSRGYADDTFQNVAKWHPLSKGGGLELQAVINGEDSNPSDSATQAIVWNTVDSHQVGLQGPYTVPSGSWNFRLPNTYANGGQVMYQNSDNPRQWAFTTGGSDGQILSKNGMTPTWVSVSGVPKTKASLLADTPASVGIMYYCTNCTTDGIVVSTGATPGGVARISARTTVIN